MDVVPVKCNVVQEHFDASGCLLRRCALRDATLHLLDGETLVVAGAKDSREFALALDESVVVRRRFVREGRLTLSFPDQRLNLLVSDAPPKPLKYLVAALIPNCSDSASEGRSSAGGSRDGKENSALATAAGLKRAASTDGQRRRRRPFQRSASGAADDGSAALPPPGPAATCTAPSMLSPEALNTEQKQVLRLVAQGGNVFFTGSAGTGKSFLLRHILAFLPRESTFVTATTGLAASLVGGMTVHSFAGFSNFVIPSDDELLAFARGARAELWRRSLIVDEVSMLDGRFFDKMDVVARTVKRSQAPFGGIQVIVCGDFFQLPPVNPGEADAQTVLCFQSRSWRRCVTHTVVLKKVHRQTESDFISVLGEVRTGRCSPATGAFLRATAHNVIEREGIEPTLLHSHNEAVETVNATRLRALDGQSVVFDARDSSDLPGVRDQLDKVCPVRRRAEYKVGAQVILAKNLDVNRGLVNGARGRITRFSEVGLPVVRFLSGVEQVVGRERWALKSGNDEIANRSQIPLNLAWALSIHKSQGMTLDCVVVSLGKVFASGMAYVALSRARSASSLRVVDLPADVSRAIHANPLVAEFYDMLERRGAPAYLEGVEPLRLD